MAEIKIRCLTDLPVREQSGASAPKGSRAAAMTRRSRAASSSRATFPYWAGALHLGRERRRDPGLRDPGRLQPRRRSSLRYHQAGVATVADGSGDTAELVRDV